MKKFMAILISMLCALGSLSFVGCGKAAGGAYKLQIWCNEAGYGTAWITDALEIFVEQDWVKAKYPEGVSYDKVDTAGNSNSGLDWLTGGGTQYDIVMPTGGLTSGNYLENYTMFANLNGLYDTQIPGEEKTLLEKMIPNVAAETALAIKGEEDAIRLSIPWINGAHGWFYNETSLREYLQLAGSDFVSADGTITLPNTTNEFIVMLEDLRYAMIKEANPGVPEDQWDTKKVTNWSIFHHNESVSYWTSDATVWWAQYDGVDGYNNYFLGQDTEGAIDVAAAAENTKSTGRLRALEVLDSIINLGNGHAYGKWNLERNTYRPTLGRLAEGSQFIFTSNGDWCENETKPYHKEGEVIRMMKTPVISSIVEKLSGSFSSADPAKADEVLSVVIGFIDAGYDYQETATQTIQHGITLEEEDYNIIKLARNTVSRVGGHGMYIPDYADAKELAKDFLLFLASDAGIESMMSNGIYSSYMYDYNAKPEVTATLTQMRKDFIKVMDDAREAGGLLRNPESFPTVYYGKFGPWKDAEHSHIGAAFLAITSAARSSAEEIWQNCFQSEAQMSIYLASSK